MKEFILCFIPLLVAVDAIGTLPLYLGLTEGLSRPVLNRILWQSLLTATLVALGFLFVGESLFRLLDITHADFMIAGGILLFIISMSDILVGRKTQRRVEPDSLGAVPIGVPLIVGPAVLTTILFLAQRYGAWLTALSVVLNVLLAVGVFWAGAHVDRLLGKAGMRTVSKVASLVLAAIAVKMVRLGLASFLTG